MRKVTATTAQALRDGARVRVNNTEVTFNEGANISRMWLHGNCIARYEHRTSTLEIFDRGWTTNTTKERLNGVLKTFGINGYINQYHGKWVYNTHDGAYNPIKSEVWRGTKEFAV